jgi:small subunit ribosomal protein S1
MTSNEPSTTPDAAPAAPAATSAEAPPQTQGQDAHAASPETATTEATGTPAGEGTPAVAADGAPKKKRRRRRKKKHPGAPGEAGAEAHAEGEGEGDDHDDHDHPATEAKEGEHRPPHDRRNDKRNDRPRPQRPQEPRERPAFSVGDVVFGKITDISDECLTIDLAGKGTAIFDRLEMNLPDEPAQGPGSDILDDDDDLPPPKPKAKEEVEGVDAAHADASADATTAETAPVEVEAAAEPHEHAHPAPHKEEHQAPAIPVVTLPPVVLEVGANFVGVVHNDGGRGGNVVLTRHPRRGRAIKSAVAAALREKTTVNGLITGAIKGGVEVDIEGLRAFAPASHVSLRMGADLRPLVGKRMPFHVTQYAKRGRDIVLSRRTMLETEDRTQREEALKRVVVGSVVEGVVRSVVQFGAFIDIGGIEGLVPLTEMSHNRGDAPGDVFTVGGTTEVQVQRIDVKGKIWLSRKATLPDPWAAVAEKYAEGTRHKGKVARLQPFGAFVELEPGIDGLVHAQDLSTKRIDHPSEVVKVGDELDVVVAHVDAMAHKIALHPVPEGAIEGEPIQKVAPHKIVKVQVVQIDPGGLQVRILGATGRHARGFITAAGTGTARGTDLRKHFPVGHQLDAKIVEIDPKRGEVKLSVKAMTESAERDAYKAYKQTVKETAKFGTLGDLLKKSQDK